MATEPTGKRMVVVDALSLIFQVFHAVGHMTSPRGLPTNALYGFIRDILFLRQKNPDYLVCAFDREEPTFRSEIYPEYKAHREPPPADLTLQIPLIIEVLKPLGVPVLSHPGYEADDVMATVARAADAEGIEVLLCTADKDCRQLITDRVRLFNLRKRSEFGKAELLADWGITPEQVIDLQALVGDTVDNVPGVKGVGYKTAAKLLNEFGTLDTLLASLDRVKGKLRETLAGAGEAVALSRQLVRLATNVPIPLDWDAWKVQPMDTEKVLQLFQEYGFRSLGEQVRQVAGIAGSPAVAAPNPGKKPASAARTGTQKELFPADSEEELFPFGANVEESANVSEDEPPLSPRPPETWQGDYRLVATSEAFADFLQALRAQQRFAMDLETTDVRPLLAEIVGVAFSWEEGKAYYLALRGPEGEATLDPKATLEALRPILEDPGRAKLNQNIKFDALVLRANGIRLAGIAGDCMVADYLLHAAERGHGMEELSRRYLNHQVIPITDLIGKKSKKTPQLRMDEVPTVRVAEYAGEDADVAWRLCNLLEPQLEPSKTLRQLYDAVEVPLIEVLVELEFNGIRLDVPLLKKLQSEMTTQLTRIEQEIHERAGHPFNIASLVQLRKVLFEELKLPIQRKTGTTGAPSTDQETLEKLAALNHPAADLPRKILEYRQIDKLKGTYVEALPDMVVPHTGRIHASFNQTVAATGRLSSSDPNLQNIPVRREMGQQIRQAFLPEPGWSLVMADYSQIELRLLAHFSEDEQLCQAFAEERDIHSRVASQIFNVPEADVSSEQRRMAKTVNFGVIYGMSAHGLSQRLSMPRDEAEAFIDAYFARYPRVLEYQQRLLRICRETGYVGTILGRRRRIDGVRADSTYQQRNQPEREAINMEIQGSAADLIKLAMLALFRELKARKWQSRMLLQIHDELVFEAPPKELSDLAALVREQMTGPLEKQLGLRVPLRVDIAAGPNWLEGEPVA